MLLCRETPEEFHFLAANNEPPLATTFKPAMKVLSRRPAPKMITKKDPITGLEKLTLQDDEDDDDSAGRKQQPTVEEIRRRQQRELEEKQRRYEEVRAKIFGESKSAPSSGQSTPGTVTPPQPQAFDGRQNQSQRGKGRGRGGYRGDHSRHESQTRRTAGSTGSRELYDPNFSPRLSHTAQRRGAGGASPQPSRSNTPRQEDQVIRAPRGPDGSGRGGFGFVRSSIQES